MIKFAYRFVVACALCLWAAPGWAVSVPYDDPAGGWLYSYEGAATEYGSGLEGIFDRSQTEDSVTYQRIQDPGDPRNQFFPT